jgi:hypothetical protein
MSPFIIASSGLGRPARAVVQQAPCQRETEAGRSGADDKAPPEDVAAALESSEPAALSPVVFVVGAAAPRRPAGVGLPN